MDYFFLDFETTSACELKRRGLDNYRTHPSTDILCVGVAKSNGPIEICDPHTFQSYLDPDQAIIVAHNAAFELAIWNTVGVNRYGWKPLKTKNTLCTMVECYAMGLPGSLEKASLSLGIESEKHKGGYAAMLKLCMPDKKGHFITREERPDLYAEMEEYCKHDVWLEREIFKRARRLRPFEHRVWQVDQDINGYGIFLDTLALQNAQKVIEVEQERFNKLMEKTTDGHVFAFTANAALLNWVRSRGVDTPSIGKAALRAVIDDPRTPPDVKKALNIRRLAAKTSTAKIKKMLDIHVDGVIRNAFQYSAAATGRWGGRGVQFQNLPRPDLEQKNIDRVIEILRRPKDAREKASDLNFLFGNVLDTLVSCIRGFIIPREGYTFIGGDWNAIEARITAWLADEKPILMAFRNGASVYKLAAARIFRVPLEDVNDFQRGVGKTATLAWGFGGGVGAFQAMAKPLGLNVTDEMAENYKRAWREANPNIVKAWYQAQDAAISAVRNPGRKIPCGKLYYYTSGSFLFCALPSGRELCYPYPKLKTETFKGQVRTILTTKSVNSVSGKWERQKIWGGTLFQNAVQAIARDVLAYTLVYLHDGGWRVVLHVHDELVVEHQDPAYAEERLKAQMEQPPLWAPDLPLQAEVWVGKRYQK